MLDETTQDLEESGQKAQTQADEVNEQAALLAFCDACGDFIEYWGFKSIHGRVWAYLALVGEPHAQSVIAQRLKVSRSSVNLAVNELASYGLVKATSELHHAPYEANLDVWPVIVQVLQRREWVLLERARADLEQLINASAEEKTSAVKTERAQQLLQMTEWAQGLLRLLINARLPQTHDSWLLWFGKAMKLSDKIKRLIP